MDDSKENNKFDLGVKGQQKFDCRTKNNQPQQRWQRQGVVNKPWVIDGLWQNGVEF